LKKTFAEKTKCGEIIFCTSLCLLATVDAAANFKKVLTLMLPTGGYHNKNQMTEDS
jgi:hypothetical protein